MKVIFSNNPYSNCRFNGKFGEKFGEMIAGSAKVNNPRRYADIDVKEASKAIGNLEDTLCGEEGFNGVAKRAAKNLVNDKVRDVKQGVVNFLVSSLF